MLQHATRYWWALALRGLLAVLFGLAAFFWPGLSIAALVFLFGFYALSDGLFAIVAGVRLRKHSDRWWTFLLQGLLSIGAGVATLLWPAITALVLLLVIAFWAIATGVLQIVLAVALRRELEREWLLIVSGVLSVVFGVLLVVSPGAGILTLVWLVGTYALLFGVSLIALGFRLRKLGKTAAP